MQELYAEALKLSWQSPYVMSSRYYAIRGACEHIAKDLPSSKAKQFMAYAYEQYKYQSNYAGD